jgi:hypothetical protein
MKGVPWPKKAIDVLRRRYPFEPTAAIAADLDVTVTACYQKARNLGIKKTATYLNGPFSCRLRADDNPGMGTRFQPGQAPANKGIKGWQAGGRAKETQFKPGNTPHTELPVGSYRFDKQGTLQQKIGTAKGSNSKRWRGVHELVWVAANGPVPPGHICVFKPGLRTTVLEEITADRVDCISFAENMRRNSYHNRYPKEIGLAIQARGALIRKIRRVERTLNQEEAAA